MTAEQLAADGDAIPKGGDDGLQNLETIVPAGELPSENPDTGAALDELLKQATGGAEGEPTADEKAKADADAAAAKAKEKADAEKAKADADAAAKAGATGEEKPEDKEKRLAAEKAAADKAAAASKETFDNVELPQYTKPKAAEAFAKVKTLAKIEITQAQERATKAEAAAEELKKQLAAKPGLDPATDAELKELRAFRQKLDVEASPEFKEFDTQAKSNEASIIGKLKSAGFPADWVKKIEDIGVSEVDWEPIFAKVPSQVRRYIESKLVENEDLGEKKTKAIEAAKANAAEYLKTRDPAKQGEVFSKETKAKVDEYAPQLGWLKDKEIPAKATDEERKALEAHNKFVSEIRADMESTVGDNSAETKAVLIVGYAQLRRVRADFENFKLDKVNELAAKDAEIAKLTKERDDAKAFVERVKGKSTARLSENAPKPPPGGEKPKADISEPTGDALDRIRAQVEAEREG